MRTHNEMETLIGPVVTALGCELWAVEFNPHSGESLLCVYIDKPEGVDLDDCERVSREVAALLDVEDPIAGAYRLEVSSPGLDRRLVKREHFVRFRGSEVRIELTAPLDGRRRFRGELLDVEAGVVVLGTAQGELRLPWAEIDKARVVPKLDFARVG